MFWLFIKYKPTATTGIRNLWQKPKTHWESEFSLSFRQSRSSGMPMRRSWHQIKRMKIDNWAKLVSIRQKNSVINWTLSDTK